MGNKSRLKKILAVVLSAAMVMASSTITFAEQTTVSSPSASAEGYVSSNGAFEGYVDTEVFNVMVPVQTASSNVFKFTMDPQDLIKSTDAARYATATYGRLDVSKFDDDNDQRLYFLSTNAAGKYSNTSDILSVNNLSSVSVNVSLTASVADLSSNVAVSNNKSFTGVTVPSLALILKAASTKDAVSSNAGQYLDPTTKNVVSDNEVGDFNDSYVLSYNGTTDKYTYELSKNYVVGNAKSLFFGLEGACNSTDDADWSNITAQDAKVGVVWNVTPVGADKVTWTNNVLSIPASLYDADTVGTAVQFSNDGSEFYTAAAVSGTFSNGNVVIDATNDPIILNASALANVWNGSIAAVKFTDKNGKTWTF